MSKLRESQPWVAAKSASGFRYRWLSGGQSGEESKDDKLSVLDILATGEYGRLLNIEQQ